MYLTKTPKFIQKIFPNLVWKIDAPTNKTIYLSFDDGPIPEVTPWVLDQLKSYSAKASFFCLGKNVSNHPQIYTRLRAEGHSIGNHTYSHLSGWKSDNNAYFEDIEKCHKLIQSKLFRPPYGRIKREQASQLTKKYKVVMWDVLSGDFDPNLSNQKCLDNVLRNTQDGSIVVFHDSLKAKEKLAFVLPKVLEYFTRKGYAFKNLELLSGNTKN